MDSVLVIEDCRAMQKAIQRIFSADSFGVQTASDGAGGLNLFRDKLPSAVILDLTLPGISGRDLCREFKGISPAVPVIIVSAHSDIEDKVVLFEIGADDYITKPFSPKELLARVRRAIRRIQEVPVRPAQTTAGAVHHFSDVTVNFESMEVTRNGNKIELTAQEFRTLKYFLEHPGKVISRDEMLNDVWGYTHYPTTRTVDNHVLRLRHKLEDDSRNPKYFLTLHGSGYKFNPSGN